MTASIHKYKFSAQALITVEHDAVLQDNKIPMCQQKDLDSACSVDSEAVLKKKSTYTLSLF